MCIYEYVFCVYVFITVGKTQYFPSGRMKFERVIQIYIFIYTYIFTYTHTYIYIHTVYTRKTVNEPEIRSRSPAKRRPIHIHTYIYIPYIHEHSLY